MDTREDTEGIKGEPGVRADLHLHSWASGAATNWWVKGLAEKVEARESYTTPEDVYRMCKDAGMDFVTLTDHETIDGALTLTHHPDFFVSEEISAVFPEDGSYVDILVFGLDAEIHKEAQARRGDVYALVDYLREAGVVHALAHPMYEVPGPLGRDQVEKRLVLFGLWEFINGSRPRAQNRLAQELAAGTGGVELRQMALRQGLAAPTHRFIAGTGGSDDHGGLYIGTTYTHAPKVGSAGEFLEALAMGEVRPGGEDGSVRKMTHTGFRIMGGALKDKGSAGPNRMLQKLALRAPILQRFKGRGNGQQDFLEYLPLLAELKEPEIRAEMVRRYEKRLSGALDGLGSGFPMVDFLSSIGDLIDGHMFIAPYVGVHGYFGREIRGTKALRRKLMPDRPGTLSAGIFVDGVDAVHGVATMYRNLQVQAREQHAGRLQILRCGPGEAEDVYSFRPIATLPAPLYDGLTLGVPSLLDVMDHVAEAGYDVLHIATPGPLGIAALVTGLTLGIPVVGAYHTEFGAYARALSGDDLVAEIVEVAVREFYERCAAVAVPSQATALALKNRGYRIQSFEVLKNGVDTGLFNPGRRDPELKTSLGGGKKLLLYVGRVSKEKGLDKFAGEYLGLRRHREDVHLVIVGDGPYRKELQERLGETATFTGFLKGEALARTFASCDIFVFPSSTDTLGRAVAEAQASGLPAVVCGIGGPRECIQPGVSGLVAGPEDAKDFFVKVEKLLDDVELRESMGYAAREFAESLSWEAVLDGLISLHAKVAGVQTDLPARSVI